MRVHFYNLLSFPAYASLHVNKTTTISSVLEELADIFNCSEITTIFDSQGNIINDLINQSHGNICFASDSTELPEDFSTIVANAHINHMKILSKKEITLDILEMSILGILTFYISWFLTEGGIIGALPLCIFLTYACFRRVPAKFSDTAIYNIKRLMTTDRKYVYVVAIWFILKTIFEQVLPNSTGTSPMLVLFTISIALVFAIPRCIQFWKGIITEGKVGPCYFFRPFKKHPWLSIMTFLSLLVLIKLDPYFTSLFSMSINQGKCGLLLSEESKYLDDAMDFMNQFPSFFNENHFAALDSIFQFTSGLGEVSRILPALITVSVFAQIAVPKQYELARHILFRAVLAQVIGGSISAFLKIMFHRFRPMAYGDPLMFQGPGFQVVNHMEFSKLDLSFPCGHATITFATCYVFYKGILAFIKSNRPNFELTPTMKYSIGIVLFTFSSLTGLSRIAHCKHWASDVLAGSWLGILMGAWSIENLFNLDDLQMQTQIPVCEDKKLD